MTTSHRAFIALVLLTAGLAFFLVDGVSHGWRGISVFGLICLVVAIVAQLVVIRKSRTH